MRCNIMKSPHYGDYCKKRACGFYPCSQLLKAHRKTIEDIVVIKQIKRMDIIKQTKRMEP